MAADPITAVAGLADTVISRLWPDKTESERAQMAAALAIVQGQLAINQAEASSPSTFVAGWRPFIGWCCGVACGWNWLGLPVAKFGLALAGHPLDIAPADLAEMWPILLGMLGLGTLRTAEKIKGAEGNR